MPSSVTANSESSPVVAPQEMDVSYGSRSVRRASDPGYTRVAVHDREEIEEVDTVINVDDLLRSRQFTSDGAPEVCGISVMLYGLEFLIGRYLSYSVCDSVFYRQAIDHRIRSGLSVVELRF